MQVSWSRPAWRRGRCAPRQSPPAARSVSGVSTTLRASASFCLSSRQAPAPPRLLRGLVGHSSDSTPCPGRSGAGHRMQRSWNPRRPGSVHSRGPPPSLRPRQERADVSSCPAGVARGLGAAGLHRLGHRDAGARHRRQRRRISSRQRPPPESRCHGLERGEIVAVFNKDAVNPDSYRSSSLPELQQLAGDEATSSRSSSPSRSQSSASATATTPDEASSGSSPTATSTPCGVAPRPGTAPSPRRRLRPGRMRRWSC